MAAPGEETRTTKVLSPSRTLRLLSQESGTSNGKPNLFEQDVKPATGKVKSKQQVFTHGLHPLQHFSCDSPVRCMVYSEAAAAFISLHSDNTVCLYTADGHTQTSLARLPFLGLTATKIPGLLVGWGPGPVITFLDSELRPLEAAPDALDVRVCQTAQHCTDFVTAGAGNVCVWSELIMVCKVKIQKGLRHSTFTQMALAPRRSDRHHRAFVVCGLVVTVVDLDAGKVLEHKRDLCSCAITAMVYCSQLDCLITASQERSIRVWGPDWELRVAFVGHDDVVSSLFYCSALSMLLSASVDCTIRCWSVDEGHVVECVHAEPNTPLLCIGGTNKGDTFFSFSHKGVDLWTFRTLYSLHCKLKQDGGAPLRQILASPFPAPFPSRVLCLSGDSDVTLVTAETGAVLTSFKAKQRIMCADYCLQKEIMLALTDTGTVLQANTLTNPITLMREWKGKGQESWTHMDHVTEKDAQPGPASCLILYSSVVNTQEALEEWMNLQEMRGCSRRNKVLPTDAKNKFMIILGQSGGCLSVLKIDNGKVLYRTRAHNGQRVTAMKAYPENDCFLSTGEDMTVVVWRVNPYSAEVLSQQLSLHCDHPQVYLAALEPQLALTVQQPNNGTYNLIHVNILNQSKTDCPPNEGHSDQFTGLCVCHDLDVLVSSSLDGTVCIWNEKNHLIKTLQLNAVPECLAYTGFGGEVFLGIKGDLYRMNCAKFLPHYFQQMLLYTYYVKPPPDIPIIETKTKSGEGKNASTDKDEATAGNVLLTEDIRHKRQKEYVSSMDLTADLAALIRGSVKCQRRKPPSTKETRKEAFDNYMKIIYGIPPIIKIDLEDSSDPDEFEIPLCKPEPYYARNRIVKEDVHPKSKVQIPVSVEKKQENRAPPARTPIKVKPRPFIPKKPVVEKKYKEYPQPPKRKSKEKPIPNTPPPPPPTCRRPKTLPPPREPSPKVPMFLKQFEDAGWFKDLYPDKKCIPGTLSPEDFSLQLLGGLNTCSSPMQILAALHALHNQGLLQTTDTLYRGLIDLVPQFVRPPLSSAALVGMLKLLMSLKSVSYELVKKLLTLLAFKNLGLRETVLRMLTSVAVNEAEQWLLPELETWDSELQDRSDIWTSLHDRADSWLELWISKYKEHSRHLYLRSKAKCKPSIFSAVDVLNYFCSVQKEYRKAQRVPPPRRKDTVLLPGCDSSSQPIFRLGETHTMARAQRRPPIILPPLTSSPFLQRCLRYTLPITKVTISPFHVFSEKDFVKTMSYRSWYTLPRSYTNNASKSATLPLAL